MALKTSDTYMSSESLENTDWSPRSSSERILMLLKMHGKVYTYITPIKDLALLMLVLGILELSKMDCWN